MKFPFSSRKPNQVSLAAIAAAIAKPVYRFVWSEDGGSLIFTLNALPSGEPEWEGPVGSQTLTVSVTTVLPPGPQFAPLNVRWNLNVTGSAFVRPADPTEYDPTHSKIVYVTHTGDTGSYDQPWHADASHVDKRYQYGPNPVHVYDEPGAYTVQFYVYDENGQWGVSAPMTVTAISKEAAFSPAYTVVVSNDPAETWADAPPHDLVNRCTTLAAGLARWNTLSNTASTRLCLKGGQTYQEAVNGSYQIEETGSRMLWDTWGTGQAIVDLSLRAGNVNEIIRSASGFVFSRWRMIGPWDYDRDEPKNGYGTPGNAASRPWLGNIGWWYGWTACNVLVHKSQFEDFGAAVFGWVEGGNEHTYCETVFTRCSDYSIYSGLQIAILGCRHIEEYGASLGLMGRNRVGGNQRGGRSHRFFREDQHDTIYLRGNYVEARGGWSGQNNSATLYAPQQLMRLHTFVVNTQIGKQGRRHYMTGCTVAGAWNLESPSITAAEPGTSRNGVNAVVEACRFIFDPQSWVSNIHLATGRHTVRNCEYLCLNTPARAEAYFAADRKVSDFEWGPVRMGQFANFISIPDWVGPSGDDIDIIHNSFVQLRNTTDDPNAGLMIDDQSTGAYISTIGNNWSYRPNQITEGAVTTIAQPCRILDGYMQYWWTRAVGTLTDPVAPGEQTPLIPYPTDWYLTPLTQADFVGSAGNHSLRIGTVAGSGAVYAQVDWKIQNEGIRLGAASFSFEAGGFRVTNTHPTETWPAGGVTCILDLGVKRAPDLVATVDQTELVLRRPVTPPSLDPGIKSTLFDFTYRLRPNAGFAISPTTGTNARGALLPA